MDNQENQANNSAVTLFKKVVCHFDASKLMLLYWLLFWLMNGIDKFVFRTDLYLFTWYGKDRTGQFTGYLTNIDWSEALVYPLLVFAGIWEILVALPFILALKALLFPKHPESKARKQLILLLKSATFLSILTLVGFSFFDIIFGDRAELLEHGTYLALAVFTHMIFEAKLKL